MHPGRFSNPRYEPTDSPRPAAAPKRPARRDWGQPSKHPKSPKRPPFRPRELVARVKARLRRRQAAPQASSTLLSAGAIEVDLRTHLATLHGEPLHLTPKEFAILAILAQSVGSPVSAADLFEGAWHERFDDAAANTVMVHIRRLRKKLADIDASTTFIETAWGVGYKLRGAPGDTGHGA